MENLTDDSAMPFGVYKGKPMIEVPDSYLKTFWKANRDDFVGAEGFALSEDSYRVMQYIQDSFNESELND